MDLNTVLNIILNMVLNTVLNRVLNMYSKTVLNTVSNIVLNKVLNMFSGRNTSLISTKQFISFSFNITSFFKAHLRFYSKVFFHSYERFKLQ